MGAPVTASHNKHLYCVSFVDEECNGVMIVEAEDAIAAAHITSEDELPLGYRITTLLPFHLATLEEQCAILKLPRNLLLPPDVFQAVRAGYLQ